MSRKVVSDRAALHFLECTEGFDVATLKQKIAMVTQSARKAGDKNAVVDGVRFRLSRSGKVQSVHPVTKPLSKRANRWARRRRK